MVNTTVSYLQVFTDTIWRIKPILQTMFLQHLVTQRMQYLSTNQDDRLDYIRMIVAFCAVINYSFLS